MSITHDQVVAALARYHRQRSKPPLVFTEIAVAGSYASRGRVDVVAATIGSGYSGLTLDGYECKATVSDFEGDVLAGKWEKYLGPFRRFYFATPKGLVSKADVPDPAGLIVWNPDGDSWSTVKKAGWLEPDVGDDVALRLLRRANDQAADAERRAGLWSHRWDEKQKRRAELLDLDDPALAYRLNSRIRDLVVEGLQAEARYEERVAELAERETAVESLEEILAAVGTVLREAERAVGGGRYHFGRKRREAARERLLDLASMASPEDEAV